MYSNIGKKIQRLAIACAIIGMIASISIGASLIKMSDGGYYFGTNETLLLIGIVVIILGSILSWVLSFVLYGFGRLVENSDIIARQYRRKTGDENYQEEPSQPISKVIRNAMDKGAIAAKSIYDKSGEFIDNQAQKAQARRENAVTQQSAQQPAQRPAQPARRPAQPAQRPAQPTRRPVQPQKGPDSYSNPTSAPQTQQPAETSFASNYEFLDI